MLGAVGFFSFSLFSCSVDVSLLYRSGWEEAPSSPPQLQMDEGVFSSRGCPGPLGGVRGKRPSSARAGIPSTPCSSHGAEQGLSARLAHDNQPISRADTANKARCLTLIYGGRL